jgi:energy-coupling factor transporter ATP-binding protein EcfA2
MLAIGRALMSKPRLLLLDEPSLGLAPLIVRQIFAAIRDLNEQEGLTVLLVEQNANQALRLAHRGYVLVNGRITWPARARTCWRCPRCATPISAGGIERHRRAIGPSMLRLTELKLPLDHEDGAIEAAVRARLGLRGDELRRLQIARRAWDARKKSDIHLVYSVDIAVADEAALLRRAARDRTLARTLAPQPDTTYRHVARAPDSGWKRPVVIGTGPCGLLRRADPRGDGLPPHHPRPRQGGARAHQGHLGAVAPQIRAHPESNVQFGEGGAGTFSDGKLYSGIKAPEAVSRKVLTEFVEAGAPEEILYVAKPHIGTFRLVTMVESLRAKIEALGGEYRFRTKVVDFVIEAGRDGARRIRGVVTEAGETIATDHVVLAIGHSARDTFAGAARSRRLHRGEALLHRRAHRAPAIADRPRPLRRFREAPDPRRRRLQAGAPLRATDAASIPSACARAAPWSPRPARKAAS